MISWRRYLRNRANLEKAILEEPAVLNAVAKARAVLADLATADVRLTRLDLAWAASDALEKVAEGLEPPKHVRRPRGNSSTGVQRQPLTQ